MLKDILGLSNQSIHIADAGAAFFGEPAPYQPLIDMGLAKLSAFDPDSRESSGAATLLPLALGDGQEHTLHICPKGLGMSSLLEPDPAALSFFNCFADWGKVESTERINTYRLDGLDIPPIDFLKMDVQGSELSILKHGRAKLSKCVAVQTEISFIPLYKTQPAFGEIDIELRHQGFIPHCFMNIKPWAISPTIRDGEPRRAFNQLLEADIVYVRDIIHPESMDNGQIAKLAAIAHYVYGSSDLAARCLLELQSRSAIHANSAASYLEWINK